MADDKAYSQSSENQLAHYRHELRTPVNAVIGYSEMLLEDAEDDADAEFCATLQEVQLLGRALQEQIGKHLNSDYLADESTLDEIVGVAQTELTPLCDQVGTSVAQLLQRCSNDKAFDSFASDLERIAVAERMLRELLENGVQGNATVQAAQTQKPIVDSSTDESAGTAFDDWPEQRGHVLIVDDNQMNRDMLARGLLRQQLHFALAGNGKQALDMLSSKAFDVVLLDIMMPVMDGFETLKRIKADPDLKHVPVIMISALDQIDSVVRCIEMGAEDYLPKPFDPTLLRARVGACLEKKRLRDQELEYLRNVKAVTQAASDLESGAFDAGALEEAAQRTDSLGQLARVFQSMAREVQAREQRLKQQVQQLRVEIDESRKQSQVEEITDTDYFQELQQKASALRNRRK